MSAQESTAKAPIEPVEEPVSIAKPATSGLAAFKSKRAPGIGGVETLPAALPHHRASDAKDFIRLHPDVASYWSDELCFVLVPIEGGKPQLHLIAEYLAAQLPSAKVKRQRLALGMVATGNLFLCEVPSQNIDNSFNKTNLEGCDKAKTHWVEVVREEGHDRYTVRYAKDQDAYPPPQWPAKSLDELIELTFQGRMIFDEDHPAWRRLIGAKVLP